MFLFEPCQPKNLMITYNFSVNIGGEMFQKKHRDDAEDIIHGE